MCTSGQMPHQDWSIRHYDLSWFNRTHGNELCICYKCAHLEKTYQDSVKPAHYKPYVSWNEVFFANSGAYATLSTKYFPINDFCNLYSIV